MTAIHPINAPSTTWASQLNAQLAEMHGPTTCLASTMNKMVPVPAVAALPDANVLDLHISLSRPASANTSEALDPSNGPVATHLRARYATTATAAEATAFYQSQLGALSDDVTLIAGTPTGADAHFDAAFDAGRYGARIFDLGRSSTVIVQSESTQQATGVPFLDLASWHGLGRFESATIDRTEVFTVAADHREPPQVIYSTEYYFPGASRRELRSMVDVLLMNQGWAATETFENSLLFAGTFEGEAHVAGHDGNARLTLVGEYPLCSFGN